MEVDIKPPNADVCLGESTYARNAQSRQRSSQPFGRLLEGILVLQSPLSLQGAVSDRRGKRERISRLHTEELRDVAFKEYGDEVEGERGEESYGSQMDELCGEHVGLRLAAEHGDHLRTR